ncbi:MAG: OpgC family protein [Candidatus Binataceae bacterium]
MAKPSDRDFRLDFCRGLALIVIFIDHIPGNPLSNWTLRNFFFCDAAEIFVLISGMASYLAYGSRFDRAGLGGCAKAVGRRWLKIYFAHLLLLAVIAGLIVWASRSFTDFDYLEWLKLKWLVEDPKGAIFSAATLRYMPRLIDILPLYMFLLIIAPLLIAMVKWDYRVTLLVSAALYASAWVTGWNFSADKYGREWYLNPLSWQFLYTLGMTVTHLSRTAPEKLPWRRGWLLGSAVFLVGATLIAWPLNQLGITQVAPFSYIWPADKTYLAPLRILNVLALLYVFVSFVSPQAAWFKNRAARILISCGRNSLPIYGLGLVLSCIGCVVIQEVGSTRIAHMAVNAFGISALFVVAAMLDRLKETRRPVLAVVPAIATARQTTRFEPAAAVPVSTPALYPLRRTAAR